MFKKGQAAMEFLMTYGWAILVVLAAIAALAYFGVLSPAKMLPERCVGPSGLDCIEKASMENGNVSWSTKNNQGHDMLITSITLGSSTENDCTGTMDVTNATNATSTYDLSNADVGVQNGAYVAFKASCPGVAGEERVHAEFNVAYTSVQTGMTASALYQMDVRQG
jgi:uncharacterized protein (UPF0333 family)